MAVMKNKNRLRNVRDQIIYINNDLTKQERQVQQVIKEKTKEERQSGKEVEIRYHKVDTDGTEWVWKNNTYGLEEKKNKGGATE